MIKLGGSRGYKRRDERRLQGWRCGFGSDPDGLEAERGDRALLHVFVYRAMLAFALIRRFAMFSFAPFDGAREERIYS